MFGLVVEEVHDTQEIVVKPLSELLKGTACYGRRHDHGRRQCRPDSRRRGPGCNWAAWSTRPAVRRSPPTTGKPAQALSAKVCCCFGVETRASDGSSGAGRKTGGNSRAPRSNLPAIGMSCSTGGQIFGSDSPCPATGAEPGGRIRGRRSGTGHCFQRRGKTSGACRRRNPRHCRRVGHHSESAQTAGHSWVGRCGRPGHRFH